MSLDRRTLIESLRKDLKTVRTVLISVSPFLSSIVMKARIVAHFGAGTAYATSTYVVAIDPYYWKTLSMEEKIKLVVHEVLHLAFSDPLRGRNKLHYVWNLVTDAVNNELMKALMAPPENGVTLDHISRILSYLEDRWVVVERGVSKEQLYSRLMKYGEEEVKRALEHCGIRVVTDLRDEGPGDCEVLQSGSPEIYRENAKEQDLKEAWERAVNDALMGAKLAGKFPSGAERLVDSLMAPSVNWRNMISTIIREGIGRSITSTYIRTSRKIPDFPGTKRFTTPKVYTLVDTSGSIGERELKQFVSEIYSISKDGAEVVVVPWDAKVYKPIEVRRPKDIDKVKEGGLKGGGGTKIGEALELVKQDFKVHDVLVILSDFEIFDWRDDAVQRLLEELIVKSSTAVLATTCEYPDPKPRRAKVVRVVF